SPRRQRARHEASGRALTRPTLATLLRFAEATRIQPAMQQRAEYDRDSRRRPEQVEMQNLRIISQPCHDPLRRPLTRQPGGCGPAEQRNELDERAKAFR